MEMRIQTLPAPEAEMAYAGEGSLCARQAQESIFSNSEMLRSRVSVVPISSPEVRLVQNQSFNAAGPGETSQEALSGGKEGKDYAQ